MSNDSAISSLAVDFRANSIESSDVDFNAEAANRFNAVEQGRGSSIDAIAERQSLEIARAISDRSSGAKPEAELGSVEVRDNDLGEQSSLNDRQEDAKEFQQAKVEARERGDMFFEHNGKYYSRFDHYGDNKAIESDRMEFHQDRLEARRNGDTTFEHDGVTYDVESTRYADTIDDDPDAAIASSNDNRAQGDAAVADDADNDSSDTEPLNDRQADAQSFQQAKVEARERGNMFFEHDGEYYSRFDHFEDNQAIESDRMEFNQDRLEARRNGDTTFEHDGVTYDVASTRYADTIDDDPDAAIASSNDNRAGESVA